MKIGDKFRYKNSSFKSNETKYDRVISDFMYDVNGMRISVISNNNVMYNFSDIELEPIQELRHKKISNLLNGNK
jgi:hypothetical protein